MMMPQSYETSIASSGSYVLKMPWRSQSPKPLRAKSSREVGAAMKQPLLKKDIESYVASCPICASAKRQQGKTPGLLQPVAKPKTPWKDISIDYNRTTRKFRKHGDRGDNWLIFQTSALCALPKNPLHLPFAQIVCAACLHGAPERIFLDCGIQFTVVLARF